MKKTVAVVLSLLACALTGFAKQYPLMGKIQDATGKPVNPTKVTVEGNGKAEIAWLKSDGLYYTNLLPDGKYSIKIVSGAVTCTGTVTLNTSDAAKSDKPVFYNFRLYGNKAVVVTTTEDPFALVALERAKEQEMSIDAPINASGHHSLINGKEPLSLLPEVSNDGHYYSAPTETGNTAPHLYYAPALPQNIQQRPVFIYDKKRRH